MLFTFVFETNTATFKKRGHVWPPSITFNSLLKTQRTQFEKEHNYDSFTKCWLESFEIHSWFHFQDKIVEVCGNSKLETNEYAMKLKCFSAKQ